MLFIIMCTVGAVVYIIYARYFRRNALNGLDYSAYTSTHEVFEGDDFYLYECMVNDKDMAMPNIRVETQLPYGLDFCVYSDRGGNDVAQNLNSVESVFVLKPNNEVKRRWRINAKKRGVYHLGSVRVVARDLFGVNRIATHYDQMAVYDNKITVLPRSIDIEREFAPATDPYGDISAYFNMISDPLSVSGAREYVAGDPINKINWKSSARMHRMIVNTDEYNEKRSYDIIFNIQSQARETEGSAPQNTDISEMGISLCATLFDKSLVNGISVRMMCNALCEGDEGEYLVSAEFEDRGDIITSMRMLAQLRSEISCRFERLLALILENEELRNDRSVILISPYVDKEIADFTKKLDEMDVPVCIFVTSHRGTSIDIPENVPVFYRTHK